MGPFREQRNIWCSIVYSWWSVFVLLLISVLLVNIVWRTYMRYRESNAEFSRLEAQYNEFDTRTKELELTISSLETPEGVEKEIRQKFNVVKPGESVVMVFDEETGTVPTTTETRSWWKKIIDLIEF